MKQYELQADFQNIPKGTVLFGPYALASSLKPAYFLKENIPPDGEVGTNGFFQSFVEGNTELFKEIAQ